MNRTSIVATVIATGGILVAGSVASVAVINAASSSQAGAGRIGLVAEPVAQPGGAPATGTPLPPVTPLDLPELPSLEPAASTPPTRTPRPKATPQQPSASSSSPANTAAVSSTAAANAAVAASGGTVVGVSKTSHGGFNAWAVRIQRADGSIVTAYVDRASGTVYDWVVNQAAPSGKPSASPSATASHDDGSETEDEGGHEGDDD